MISNKLKDKTEQVTEQVKRLTLILDGELTTKEIMAKLKLKHRPTFMYDYLKPAVKLNFVESNNPESPRSPTQKYRITEKGLLFLELLKKK